MSKTRTIIYGAAAQPTKKFTGGVIMEKALRIVWATGEVDENGNPVTRRQTISVSPNATAQDLANAVNTLDFLSSYTYVSAQLVTYETI
jgi:hypothetical protein